MPGDPGWSLWGPCKKNRPKRALLGIPGGLGGSLWGQTAECIGNLGPDVKIAFPEEVLQGGGGSSFRGLVLTLSAGACLVFVCQKAAP